MTTEKRTRRKYTEDFKRDAVALVTEQGYKMTEVGRSLGVKQNVNPDNAGAFINAVHELSKPYHRD